ncbi:MFS transporter [Planobispora rosea]|uniref:MFS transporter n=1 Tax=Planobispora rosea TaxID=35762 RepID=UPI000839DDB2|nr:MFS transporter [Planobispora rosea]
MDYSKINPLDHSDAEDGVTFEASRSEPVPAQDDMAPVGKRFISLYTLASLATATAINTPLFVTLALRVSEIDPDGKTTSFALLSGMGMLIATISAPVFGTLSDRTRSRFGMRRPWIVLGLIGTVFGGFLMGIAHDLVTLAAGWMLMSAFGTAVASLLLTAISDRVPGNQQGLLGGLVGASNLIAVMVGSLIIAFVPHSSFLQVNLPVAMAVIAVLAFILAFPDRLPQEREDTDDDSPATGGRLRNLLAGMRFDPRQEPDFARLLLSLFLISLGGALGTTYAVYFIEDHLKVGSEELTTVIAYSNAASCLPALLGSPLAGWLADRFGRRRPILLFGTVCSVIGLLITAFSNDLPTFYVGALVGGIGLAAYSGVYLGYAIATMTDMENSARNLGLTNVAISIPLTLAPFLTPFFLSLGSGEHNYISLYITGAVISITAIPVMYTVRNAR